MEPTIPSQASEPDVTMPTSYPGIPTEPQAPATSAVTAAITPSVAYESNPFRVAITGLTEILKYNPIPAIALTFVLFGLYFAIGILTLLFSIISPILGFLLFPIGLFVLFGVIYGSTAILAVDSIVGQSKKTLEIVKEGSKKILPVWGATILIGLAVAAGMILLIVPGIIFAAWFSLTYIAMYDENLGPIKAMKRSKELVSGHVLEVLSAIIVGGMLSGGLLTLAGAMAPLVGRYHQLKALKASNAPKPAVHWMNYLVPALIFIFIGLYLLFVLLLAVSGIQKNKTNTLNDYQNSTQSSSYDYNYTNN